ncbi:ligase-associated DNA damage response endonuclease PdeM [Sphingomicrobium astaxanthinifaciens]|uniref:ligase-associated DNA damage response endonuclease PdeM n=1 Tax=Sphingomicrobium astaxanthinifaciens TaxID=1227949 RepID=UPI001FCBEE8E|nr:ligase-associated DNA damage response endonuclease PdeM [Sphingomicrobium astaxanthinifaciens]MCJ7420909.1 ligase-associated DNA damage response endonuclease PdeM [Sphingomicrobium astaxanthinifaciens]
MVPLSFASRNFAVLPSGALYWEAHEALLIADLHLEKASWFARFGQMLPPYDSEATIDAVAEDVALSGARAVYCLGDSFHDRFGCDRLPQDARAKLTALTQAVRWVWITGNHDAGMIDHCGGEVVVESIVDGLVLRHEAEAHEPRPELSGHFHPKLRIKARGRRVSRRCFVATEKKMILPAYGALTGGLDADHPAILRAMGRGAAALVPVSDRVLRFPLAA